jgi:flap endonuclease-1
MGIPKLNQLLIEKCENSIKDIKLETLINKKIAVDISIYLYKFLSYDDYMEHLYLFLSIFKYYCIIPIFIFDGKPPPEKQALLKRRLSEKYKAYDEYKSLEQNKSEISDKQQLMEIEKTMISLKKKMIRITHTHISQAIELINAFGFRHYFAPNEADQLCIYLTTIGKTYATLSDDMDMIVYGCPLVLRNFNMTTHKVLLYDTKNILKDLQLNLQEFRDIVVLSGTDYEISSASASSSSSRPNIHIRKSFEYYKKYKETETDGSIDFYTWLNKNGIIENNDLYKISDLMNIETYINILDDFIKNNFSEKPKFSISSIKNIMKQNKFIFV